MKRKLRRWLTIGIILLIGCGAGVWWQMTQAAAPNTIGTTATLYLHGYSGHPDAMNTLIHHAEQAGAQQVLTATVARDGQVSWRGSAKRVAHPLVKVVFKNNTETNFDKQAAWLRSVSHQLYMRYGVRHMNFVAHSMGNLGFMTYAERWGNDPDVPKISAYVAIAGHYNGILTRSGHETNPWGDVPHRTKLAANGFPTPENPTFKPLAARRQYFPKHVRVLNIYGDLKNGTDSDGRVANNSSRSLKYLVALSHAQYQTKQFTGANAQHSKLRENPQVAEAVDAFLHF